MKKTTLLSISGALATIVAGAVMVACGDDTTGTVDSGGGDSSTADSGTPDSTTVDSGTKVDSGVDSATDTGTVDTGVDSGTDSGDAAPVDSGKDAGDAGDGGDAGIPAPPTLGAQIDRFGRPAINTALNHSFDSNAITAGTAKDMYNADTDGGAGWVAAYSLEFQKNLAILDSLDTTDAGTGCGNQIFANNDAGPARYATLAGVLANDRLWINTSTATCTQYLGVELTATGVLTNPDGGAVNECGGRKLNYPVIWTTYSAVAVGALSGVTDGLTGPVAAKTNGTTFPYLATPQ
jgi:hypothetical protein